MLKTVRITGDDIGADEYAIELVPPRRVSDGGLGDAGGSVGESHLAAADGGSGAVPEKAEDRGCVELAETCNRREEQNKGN